MALPTDTYINAGLLQKVAVTITSSGAGGLTATVTQDAHGYITGDKVKIEGATEAAYNGNWSITKINITKYKYTMLSDPGGDATGSPVASTLTGVGSFADPYTDLQYAFDVVLRDAANGNRFALKSSVNYTLTKTLDLAFYGSPTNAAPLVIEGYTTNLGDGGIATIDGSGFTILNEVLKDFIHLLNIQFQNSGVNHLVQVDNKCLILNCIFDDAADGLITGEDDTVLNCSFTNISGTALANQAGASENLTSLYNYFKGNFDFAIDGESSELAIYIGNIMSLDGPGMGIHLSAWVIVVDNSIKFNGVTGEGYTQPFPVGSVPRHVFNNIVEGGDVGFRLFRDASVQLFTFVITAYNASSSVTGFYLQDHNLVEEDNESLSGSLFLKSGADTFANIENYFLPANNGNIRNGAYPIEHGIDKGAVQRPSEVGGGGGGGAVDAVLAETELFGEYFVG
jgi:hypothetical protein